MTTPAENPEVQKYLELSEEMEALSIDDHERIGEITDSLVAIWYELSNAEQDYIQHTLFSKRAITRATAAN